MTTSVAQPAQASHCFVGAAGGALIGKSDRYTRDPGSCAGNVGPLGVPPVDPADNSVRWWAEEGP